MVAVAIARSEVEFAPPVPQPAPGTNGFICACSDAEEAAILDADIAQNALEAAADGAAMASDDAAMAATFAASIVDATGPAP